MIWQRYPSVRLLICFIAAIILYPLLELPQNWIFLFFGISFSLSFFIQLFPFLNRGIGVFGIGLIFKLCAFCAMLLILSFQDVKNQSHHYLKENLIQTYYQFKLLDNPQEKEKVFAVQAELKSLINGESKNGRVLLYFEKDSTIILPKYGDQIIWKGQLNLINGPKNPNEFDYRTYLENSKIFAQGFVKNETWFLLEPNIKTDLKSLSLSFRKRLLQEIDTWAASKEVLDISKALLLGYKSDLDKDLRSSYSNTGVAHILAVSGLHVGMLYLLLSYVLFFLKNIKGGEILRTVILLGALWFYAFLTGLSPSVLRSVCMFSFVAFGGFFGREVSIYNTLSASAILLLILNPQLLYNLGFQLSYSAVFFIVWMQKYLNSLWSPKFWIGKQIWSICSVSISAQIGTSILSIYYFHQFPSYFLLSNILVIPLITVIMYCGLTVLILNLVGISAVFLFKVYTILIESMNFSIRFLEKIPGSTINSLHLSFTDLLAAYFFLFLILTWLFYGKLWRLYLSIGFFLVLIGAQIIERKNISETDKLILFSSPGHMVIGLQQGTNFELFASEEFLQDQKQFSYRVKPYLISQNISNLKRRKFHEDFTGINALKINNFLKTKHGIFWEVQDLINGPSADYWLLNEKFQPLDTGYEKPKMVFINARLPSPILAKWIEWSEKFVIPIWDLNRKGYYEILIF